MLFNSIEFLVFFPLVFLIYWFVLKNRLRLQNLFLLAASYVFYGWWDWRFLSLIIISSAVDYFVGRQLNRAEKESVRKGLLMISLAVNLGLLGYFKYANFFIDSLISAFGTAGIHLNIRTLHVILPVGISFYTFQTLSYTIDIYRRRFTPTSDVIAFFAYVAFFPQLVAGPIERAFHLVPQFLQPRVFDYSKAVRGCRLILWGFFKKVVIADRLAFFVNHVYEAPASYQGADLILATFFFAVQIYCDFSGYSDIAIGTARLFGFDLMTNFQMPYFSRSIREFWGRWHISLSTWFRDYVYIPLGGSRTRTARWMFNLMVTFVVSGMWHGAKWNFILWGALHGTYAMIETLMTRNRMRTIKIPDLFQWLLTFCLVNIGWIFFRANTLADSFYILKSVFRPECSFKLPFIEIYDFMLSLAFITVLFVSEICIRHRDRWKTIKKLFELKYMRWGLYYMVLYCIMFFGVFQKKIEFIYFQF